MKKRIITLSGLLLFACALFITLVNQGCGLSASGKDWTSWRGPYGNGSTNESEWNPLALSDSANIIWSVNIGVGHGTPAIKGKHVFVYGNELSQNGADSLQYDVVRCLDSGTGEELWNFAYRSDAGEWPGPFSSPVIDDDKLYIISKHGHVYCLRTKDGSKVWDTKLDQFGFQKPGSGFACSPVFFEDKMLIKAGETGIVLNSESGERIWNGTPKRAMSYSSPVIFNINNQAVTGISNGDTLRVVAIKSGELLFSHPWGDSGNDPTIVGDSILLSNYNDGAQLIDISVVPPKVVWESSKAKTLFQGYVHYQDHVYGYNRNSFVCIDIKTGEIVWKEELGQWGSMCLANDKLIIVKGNGELIIAKATHEGYQPISQARVLNLDDKGNENVCWTMPVLSHGKIYIRSNKGELACVNVKS